ncbi:MAG: hypothetical protein WD014_07635 [Dongiaceae bacterium]
MLKLTLIVVLVVAVVIGGGLVYLANWDIPAPTATMEKDIPNDRLAP